MSEQSDYERGSADALREDERSAAPENWNIAFYKQGYAAALADALTAVTSVYMATDDGEILRQGGSWENALDRAISALKKLEDTSAVA